MIDFQRVNGAVPRLLGELFGELFGELLAELCACSGPRPPDGPPLVYGTHVAALMWLHSRVCTPCANLKSQIIIFWEKKTFAPLQIQIFAKI